MIILAYYTVGTPYQNLVHGFKKSLRDSNPSLEVIVQPLLCQGSWEKNCGLKSEVIFKTLLEQHTDILYIDIDALVKEKIRLPNIKEDIAVYYKKGELLSGTIFIKNTIGARELLHMWCKAQEKNPNRWDQRVLDDVIKKNKIKVYKLDEKFCCIYDNNNCKRPIIVHNQASRKFKKLIGGDIMDIPRVVGKMRIIHNRDGTVSIARRSKPAEKWLDENLERMPNQLRWKPIFKTKHGIDKLVLQGKQVYIIGKGPSLDNLTKKDFPNKKAPILCVNESIHAIEKLGLPNDTYVVVQDALLKDGCKPKDAGVICSKVLNNFYADCENKYVFEPKTYFKSINYTPIIAINIAKEHGITSFTMLGFDSIVNGDNTYATSIGYQHPKTYDSKRYEKNGRGHPQGYQTIVFVKVVCSWVGFSSTICKFK